MFLDTFMPRGCKLCGCRLADNEETICARCASQLPFTDDHLAPYDNDTARILWGRLDIERATAFMHYQPNSLPAQLIYILKYGNCPDIGVWLGEQMADFFAPYGLFDGIDAIVPIPIHKRRERERGYNQSQEIARGIADITNIKVCKNVVERIRYTTSQTQLSHTERASNVEDAFDLVHPDAIEGKHVLLVDDIITTGATLAACGNTLGKACGVKISVMTVGRTGSQ